MTHLLPDRLATFLAGRGHTPTRLAQLVQGIRRMHASLRRQLHEDEGRERGHRRELLYQLDGKVVK